MKGSKMGRIMPATCSMVTAVYSGVTTRLSAQAAMMDSTAPATMPAMEPARVLPDLA